MPARANSRMSVKADPVERVAGLAFFAFTFLQIAFFVVDSNLSASGLILLSPLHVSAANLAKQYPQYHHYIDDVLVPGAWVREALSPYIKCKFTSKEPCTKQRARLFDLQYVRNGTNLPLLVQLLESQGLGPQQQCVIYGCAMIVLSALFSLYYSVKTAVLGFVLLAYGLYEGAHMALPPMILVGFLCIFAGFNLGQPPAGGPPVKPLIAAAAAGSQAQQQKQQQRGGSSRGTPQKSPSKGSSSARKQRKA